jgi:hypothetical protein
MTTNAVEMQNAARGIGGQSTAANGLNRRACIPSGAISLSTATRQRTD